MQYVVLDPIGAVVIALFDGVRSVGDVKAAAAYIFNTDVSRASKLISNLIKDLSADRTKALLPKKQLDHRSFVTYDPKEFVTASQIGSISRRLEVPICLAITLTHRCQTNCRYCYAERRHVSPKDELSVSAWCSLIDQAVDMGIDRISLLGGDPLARADTPEVLEHLAKHGMHFFLSTKCHIDMELARRLAAIQGDHLIQISMDAPVPEIADFLTNCPGYFERAFNSITNLVTCGVPVRGKAVLTSYNARMAPELIRLWHKLGIRSMQLIDYGRSYYRHTDDLFVAPEDSAWIHEQVEQFRQEFPEVNVIYGAQSSEALKGDEKLKPKRKRWEKWDSRARCSAGSSSLSVAPDGLVFLCEQIPQTDEHIVGDLKSQTIEEVWNSERLLSYIYPAKELFVGSVCYDCQRFNDCHRNSGHCFRDALFYYGSRYMPPPSCPEAAPGPRLY
jgi:radical SAM protein with 4Fe4S-binding SPASM domain